MEQSTALRSRLCFTHRFSETGGRRAGGGEGRRLAGPPEMPPAAAVFKGKLRQV